MLTIALEHIEMYAYHGFYPEETVMGNWFIVDVAVSFEEHQPVTHLYETVNYEGLFHIVQQVMTRPRPLLEEVVQDMSLAMHEKYAMIRKSIVTLRKLHPPLGGQVQHSMVTLEKQY
ncbi:dihydroneopterin aldolase [Chitinophaga costaii]|uniref:Dihydroneopterin aldolase n=1 Tax=Chitinophaga costaii TaxID=1335309 RepID=A0A1C4E663_9BACT|nr:dihydroneopterin aldolase [Chitinophaga costaii]PUZ24295.1 dihydroneopterin aldolase [Chitinophaga costaii]SCC39136.1 dihydroneopterin aldolase [Chitinophaga costaii]